MRDVIKKNTCDKRTQVIYMREKSTVRLRKNGVSRTWKSLRGEGGGRRQVLVGEGGGGMNVIDKGRKEKQISLSARKFAIIA